MAHQIASSLDGRSYFQLDLSVRAGAVIIHYRNLHINHVRRAALQIRSVLMIHREICFNVSSFERKRLPIRESFQLLMKRKSITLLLLKKYQSPSDFKYSWLHHLTSQNRKWHLKCMKYLVTTVCPPHTTICTHGGLWSGQVALSLHITLCGSVNPIAMVPLVTAFQCFAIFTGLLTFCLPAGEATVFVALFPPSVWSSGSSPGQYCLFFCSGLTPRGAFAPSNYTNEQSHSLTQVGMNSLTKKKLANISASPY